MNRISALARRPKRTVGALAVALAAVGVAVGSGADFTATSANPGNTFTAGTLSMDNSKANSAVLTAGNMRPGGTAQTGTVDIENTGSLSGTFTLSKSAQTNSDSANPLADKLNVVVKDCGVYSGSTAPSCDSGDTDVYTGTLAAMSGNKALGSYAGGAKHRYEFSVSLDSSAGNAYQGDSSSATFDWNAAS